MKISVVENWGDDPVWSDNAAQIPNVGDRISLGMKGVAIVLERNLVLEKLSPETPDLLLRVKFVSS